MGTSYIAGIKIKNGTDSTDEFYVLLLFEIALPTSTLE